MCKNRPDIDAKCPRSDRQGRAVAKCVDLTSTGAHLGCTKGRASTRAPLPVPRPCASSTSRETCTANWAWASMYPKKAAGRRKNVCTVDLVTEHSPRCCGDAADDVHGAAPPSIVDWLARILWTGGRGGRRPARLHAAGERQHAERARRKEGRLIASISGAWVALRAGGDGRGGAGWGGWQWGSGVRVAKEADM